MSAISIEEIGHDEVFDLLASARTRGEYKELLSSNSDKAAFVYNFSEKTYQAVEQGFKNAAKSLKLAEGTIRVVKRNDNQAVVVNVPLFEAAKAAQ